MDDLSLGQLAQQIKWMEDERRKDKAQIATLQEQLVGQASEIAEATRRLQELDNTPQSDRRPRWRACSTPIACWKNSRPISSR